MQDAHNDYDITDFHGALLDIISVMNQPLRDEQILQAAGIQLEQMLFPLLVAVGRHGPVGVVELADHLGRDYTTVSRQVARLEQLGLVTRRASAEDGRVREARITPLGKQATNAVDKARARMAMAVFRDWPQDDFDSLVALLRRFADDITLALPRT